MDNNKEIDALLKTLTEQGIPGCALLVRRERAVIYEHYTGYADLELQKEMNADTLFRIYSMTKLYTCAAALQLCAENKLAFNEPVSRYLPEYEHITICENGTYGRRTKSASPLRIWNLLTMTAGIPYNGEAGTLSGLKMDTMMEQLNQDYPQDAYSSRELARRIADIPLEFEPGTGWVYGFSHDILGAVIETVTGQSLEEYFRRHLWEPLELHNTFFHLIYEKDKTRLSALYRRNESGSLLQEKNRDSCYALNAKFESGGGGVLSTLNDFSIFADLLCNQGISTNGRELLKPELCKLMMQNQLKSSILTTFPYKGYGYGIGGRVLLSDCDGIDKKTEEYGWHGVAGTWCIMNPKQKITIIYMQQMIPGMEEQTLPFIRNGVYRAMGCTLSSPRLLSP
ncbi:MAG: beta-lactamase family protein [Hungatella hathewayi]|nr:beta-lactamase family protein [Hungatella hathewayi]